MVVLGSGGRFFCLEVLWLCVVGFAAVYLAFLASLDCGNYVIGYPGRAVGRRTLRVGDHV